MTDGATTASPPVLEYEYEYRTVDNSWRNPVIIGTEVQFETKFTEKFTRNSRRNSQGIHGEIHSGFHGVRGFFFLTAVLLRSRLGKKCDFCGFRPSQAAQKGEPCTSHFRKPFRTKIIYGSPNKK